MMRNLAEMQWLPTQRYEKLTHKSGTVSKLGEMPRTPRYHPDFHADVIGGAEWYAKSSQSLALDFTQKVQDAI